MLIDTLRRIVSHQPNTIALCIDEQEYSYKTLFQRASIVAHWLNHGAIARLGIQVDRSVGNYVAIMACLLTGCAYVPLNLKLPRERLDAIEHEAQLDAIFDDKQFDFKNVKQDLIYIDTIYNPLDTKTLKYLKEKDIKVFNGLGMFIYQGQKAFYLWNKVNPEIDDELIDFLLSNLK